MKSPALGVVGNSARDLGRRKGRRIRDGFTLVELLVALGITAILAALLLSIVTNTLGIWDRSAGTLALENQARLVLGRLTIDLESAYARRDDREWIRFDPAENAPVPLRLFSAVANTGGDATETDPTTIREVAYALGGTTNGVSTLYRWEGRAIDALTDDYAFSATGATIPGAEYLLASQVRSLRMTFEDESGAVMETLSGTNWPAMAKVELTLISGDGVARLAAVASGDSTEAVESILKQTTRTATRWVELEGRSW